MTAPHIWQRWLFGLCLGLALALSGASQAQERPTLTVAVEPVYAPFEFRDAAGNLQGFDIDLMRAIGRAAGFAVKFQNITFDGIIPALQARSIDAAVGAMTITAERAQAVAFSRPYFKAGLAIAVRTTTTDINGLADLEGKKIAVQIGTTGADAARKLANAQVRTFNAAVLALQELANGNVDAVLNDAPVTLYAIKTGNLSQVRVVGQLLTEEYYGIPTPLNSPHLARINEGLARLIASQDYDRLYRQWFAADPPALPAVVPGLPSAARPSGLAVAVAALPALLAGTGVTLGLAAISMLGGLVGGSLLGITRLANQRWLRWVTQAYIDFFRGTPLIVQIFMVYFGLPAFSQSFGLTFSFDRFGAAVLALSLNCAAYMAEIVRAGIQSIDRGQHEAAASLGLNPMQAMRFVIFPQALRRMLPPIGNTFISLLKDTSLVAIIGFEELFRQGQLIVATNYRPFELYSAVALIYLALTLLASQGMSLLERRLSPRLNKTLAAPASDV